MKGRRLLARRSDHWTDVSAQQQLQRERIVALSSTTYCSASNHRDTTSPLYRPKLSSHSYRAAVGGDIREKYRYKANLPGSPVYCHSCPCISQYILYSVKVVNCLPSHYYVTRGAGG